VVIGFLDLEKSMQEGDVLLNICIRVVRGEVNTPTAVRFGIVPGSGTACECINCMNKACEGRID